MIDIKLNGDEYLEIEYGDVYTEEGAIGYFNGREIDVNIRGEIDTKKVGEQEVIYSIDNIKLNFSFKNFIFSPYFYL